MMVLIGSVEASDDFVELVEWWDNKTHSCFKGMEEFFAGKEDMFDDYKHELEEVRYFGDDSQNL